MMTIMCICAYICVCSKTYYNRLAICVFASTRDREVRGLERVRILFQFHIIFSHTHDCRYKYQCSTCLQHTCFSQKKYIKMYMHKNQDQKCGEGPKITENCMHNTQPNIIYATECTMHIASTHTDMWGHCRSSIKIQQQQPPSKNIAEKYLIVFQTKRRELLDRSSILNRCAAPINSQT